VPRFEKKQVTLHAAGGALEAFDGLRLVRRSRPHHKDTQVPFNGTLVTSRSRMSRVCRVHFRHQQDTKGIYVQKNYLAGGAESAVFRPDLYTNRLTLLYNFGSGGGTRTPDTRIMIPLL
jgi:hypothetical protein